MGYTLLWVEHLAMVLLIVATLLGCIARLKRPFLRSVLWVLVAVPPLLAYASSTAFLGYLCYDRLMLVGGLFYPLLLLTFCYLVGIACLCRFALRRQEDGSAVPVAATWPLGKLTLVSLIAVGLHMMTWWNLDLAVRQQLAFRSADSAALSLSVAPARIADRDNAALIYEQAYQSLDADSWSEVHREKWNLKEYDKWADPDGQDFDPEDPDLVSFLNEQSPTLILLRQGGKKPGCHFGREYGHIDLDLEMPELVQLRKAASLLSLNAHYRIARGDVPAALEDVDAMFAMARHVGSEPIFISILVAISIDRLAAKTLQHVLAVESKLADGERLSAGQLETVELDVSLSFARLNRRAVLLESSGVWHLYYNLSCGNPGYWAALGYEAGESLPSWVQSAYRLFLVIEDVESYQSAVTRSVGAAASPYYKAKEHGGEMDQEVKTRPMGFVAALLMPAFGRVRYEAAVGDARHQTARLGLAAARYRADTGELPQNLDALVPDYIPILPRDSFDGKPMRYRVTDEGAVIYSIGPDDKDDNGKPLEQVGEGKKVGDVTFVLKR